MNVVSKHPYSFLFAGAGIVLLAMALFVRNHTAPATGYAPYVSVSAGNTLVNPGISAPSPIIPEPSSIALTPMSSTNYLLPSVAPKNAAGLPTSVKTNTTIPSGTQTSAPPGPTASDQLLKEVYSLIPSGIALPAITKPRSPTQQALFVYGNEAGLVVITFANAHPDMAQALKEWLADRVKATKVASVQSIARDMQTAGRSLAALGDVPSAAAAANQALAKGYEDAGDKLLAVIAAGNLPAQAGDNTLVDAMKAYDATADSYTSAYIAVADIFSVHGVTFSAGDPGSAFQFSR